MLKQNFGNKMQKSKKLRLNFLSCDEFKRQLHQLSPLFLKGASSIEVYLTR